MNAVRTGLVIGALSATGVLLLAIGASERVAPGRVSTVHGRIAELRGGEKCSGCHGGWFGDMQQACQECHADIRAQIDEHRGLHGSVDPALTANCAACHGEHHGDEFQLVNPLAFSLAGVPDRAKFDHRQVGFAMDGVHLTLACKECHANADAPLVPEGQQRFTGLSQNCSTCHDDPHGGSMQVGCASCHSQQSFAVRIAIGHARWLSIDGAHAAVQCRDCHAANGAHALEKMHTGAHETASARQCADCHETPHSARFLAGNASATNTDAKAVCAACHPLDIPKFTDLRVAVTPEQHAHGGFPLGKPHDGVACASCHTPGKPYAERHTGRGPDDCRSCHTDPHRGQFDEGPFGAPGCVGCHERTHFAPHAFDRDHHARTALPLDGKHADAQCSACHRDPAEGEPRRFANTPHRCEQCHADAHRKAFALDAAPLASNPRGACAECHRTNAFADIDHAKFDHAKWTGFAIAGAHAQVDCDSCHAPAAQPDATGRRFGRIEHRGDRFAGCVTCHADVHEGVFDRDGVPAALDGRAGCERCHDTASFRALPHGFDHGAFTKFPLTGKHGQLHCSSCHARLPAPDAKGRTWAPAKGNDCADCHADRHQGQFERLGKVDCSRCHKSTTSFATLSFRHNLDSRFALSEAHQKVACAGCHKPEPINGETVVRYRPLPVECASCHGTEGGGAVGRQRRR